MNKTMVTEEATISLQRSHISGLENVKLDEYVPPSGWRPCLVHITPTKYRSIYCPPEQFEEATASPTDSSAPTTALTTSPESGEEVGRMVIVGKNCDGNRQPGCCRAGSYQCTPATWTREQNTS